MAALDRWTICGNGRVEHNQPSREREGCAPAGDSGARVLVADDNADMRDYLRRLLTEHGYEVDLASDGEAALA